MRDTTRKWGIALSDLQGDDLFLVPPRYDTNPLRTFSLYDKFEPYRTTIEEDWGISAPWGTDEKSILEKSRYLPSDPYFSEFTFDELAKYLFSGAIQSDAGLLFERRDRTGAERIPPEPFEFIYKLRNSMHHYGRYPGSWNNLVLAYYAIPDFNFGPEFEVRFDHSSYFNEWGSAQHTVDDILRYKESLGRAATQDYFNENIVYLDGVFAYFIHFRGKHVLTLGFSVGEGRIFINQIQLRQPKGNRWLYQLPTDLLSYCVNRMYEHFSRWGFDVYLVEGTSLAKRIAAVHKGGISVEVSNRITNFYNQPLVGYCRGNTYHRNRFEFYRILPC